MVDVTLLLDGSVAPAPVDALPRRVTLSRGAVERLAGLTSTPLPWDQLPGESATSRALDPHPPVGAAKPAAPGPDPGPELRALALSDEAGGLHPELPPALSVFGAPEVLVDIDVSVRRAGAPRGFAQVRSWHRWRDARVTALSTAGGAIELAWFDDDAWQVELGRAVSVEVPQTDREPPALAVQLPHELLLGAGEAVRLGRDDVLTELVRRHAGDVRIDGQEVAAGTVREQVRLLHAGSLGRMRTVVSGAEASVDAGVGASVDAGGTRRVGWVSWSLFADGWRALTPYVADRTAMVRVHPVEPPRLGVEVARLVTEVRS